MTKKQSTPLNYADAGVDIDKGNELVNRLKKSLINTSRPGNMGGLGGFGALFDLTKLDYKQPVLVSGTDGVGTKIKLAIDYNRHENIGIDLVGMCVNDLIVQGAEPLFFLDYFATSKLNVEIAETVIKGISQGCKDSGCSLIGGETAEMPGMYTEGDYDLAGFCVGIVEKDQIIDGSQVQNGDALIGLASSGCHSNGYSMVRKIIEIANADLTEKLDEKSLLDHFLTPTHLYVKPILELLKQHKVKAIAHITGGGLPENLPRVLPNGMGAKIDTNSWEFPAIFQWLQKHGNVETHEMYRTFNCGVGLVLCINQNEVETCLETLSGLGETAWYLGEITPSESKEIIL